MRGARGPVVGLAVAAVAACGPAEVAEESTASNDGQIVERNKYDNGPYDPAAELRPDLLRVQPDKAEPGEQVELHFPEETDRGVGYVLEERDGEGWELRYFLYVPDTEDREFAEPTWWHPAERGPGWEDIGVVGSGPNYAETPDTADPGEYRLCTANAGDNFCRELNVTE